MTWTTLRRIRTKRFTVLLQWEHEADVMEDLSWMDADDKIKLRTGEWTNCCFRVVVRLDGTAIAADYLGNSVYADPAEFSREHYGHNRGEGRAYFPDMLREAVKQARRTVACLPAPLPLPRLRQIG